jgi:integrase
MIALLGKLTKINGKGFVFSLDGGAKPVCYSYIRRDFARALEKIGIDEAEASRRRLTLHAWRHFVNTNFIEQGLTLEQVQGVTGHKSRITTAIYTHTNTRNVEKVVEAQEAIMGKKPKKEKQPEETAKKQKSSKGLELVKPANKTA